LDWQITAVEKWYGKRMERPARARAQTMVRAKAGDLKAVPELTQLLKSETNAFWRAVSAGLLRRWAGESNVTAALIASVADPDPLVRAMSVRSLEPLAQYEIPSVQAALQTRLSDPMRALRIDAAWAIHAMLDTNSMAGGDLLTYLRQNADQPSGQMQLGVFSMDRGNLGEAVEHLRHAVEWDTNSAPPRHALAVALSLQGKPDEAVTQLQAACRLAPRDAEMQFKLGLALNEAGKPDGARAALEQAVKLDAQFSQAWYNLGLAYNAAGQTDKALESLVRAESLDSNSPAIPYARATILARTGRSEEARIAARRALEIRPDYADAAGLLQELSK
jgi:tetratricopeptide (TPR) repeat protein